MILGTAAHADYECEASSDPMQHAHHVRVGELAMGAGIQYTPSATA